MAFNPVNWETFNMGQYIPSLQEYLTVPMAYKEEYDKKEEEQNKRREAAATMLSFLDNDKDKYAFDENGHRLDGTENRELKYSDSYQRMLDLTNEIKKASEDMYYNGYNSDVRNEMNTLRARAAEEIPVLQEAYKKRQEIEKELRALRAQKPGLYDNFDQKSIIDAIVKNPTFAPNMIDSDAAVEFLSKSISNIQREYNTSFNALGDEILAPKRDENGDIVHDASGKVIMESVGRWWHQREKSGASLADTLLATQYLQDAIKNGTLDINNPKNKWVSGFLSAVQGVWNGPLLRDLTRENFNNYDEIVSQIASQMGATSPYMIGQWHDNYMHTQDPGAGSHRGGGSDKVPIPDFTKSHAADIESISEYMKKGSDIVTNPSLFLYDENDDLANGDGNVIDGRYNALTDMVNKPDYASDPSYIDSPSGFVTRKGYGESVIKNNKDGDIVGNRDYLLGLDNNYKNAGTNYYRLNEIFNNPIKFSNGTANPLVSNIFYGKTLRELKPIVVSFAEKLQDQDQNFSNLINSEAFKSLKIRFDKPNPTRKNSKGNFFGSDLSLSDLNNDELDNVVSDVNDLLLQVLPDGDYKEQIKNEIIKSDFRDTQGKEDKSAKLEYIINKVYALNDFINGESVNGRPFSALGWLSGSAIYSSISPNMDYISIQSRIKKSIGDDNWNALSRIGKMALTKNTVNALKHTSEYSLLSNNVPFHVGDSAYKSVLDGIVNKSNNSLKVQIVKDGDFKTIYDSVKRKNDVNSTMLLYNFFNTGDPTHDTSPLQGKSPKDLKEIEDHVYNELERQLSILNIDQFGHIILTHTDSGQDTKRLFINTINNKEYSETIEKILPDALSFIKADDNKRPSDNISDIDRNAGVYWQKTYKIDDDNPVKFVLYKIYDKQNNRFYNRLDFMSSGQPVSFEIDPSQEDYVRNFNKFLCGMAQYHFEELFNNLRKKTSGTKKSNEEQYME